MLTTYQNPINNSLTAPLDTPVGAPTFLFSPPIMNGSSNSTVNEPNLYPNSPRIRVRSKRKFHSSSSSSGSFKSRPQSNIPYYIPYDENLVYMTKEGKSSLSSEGLGGSYIVKGKHGLNVSVFKPYDEEPGCKLNPKNNFSSPRKGIKPGEGYIREVAAFLLDHEHFAGVPFTQFFDQDISGEKKVGSLQRYVPNLGSITDFGLSLFSVSNVQRIAQLDIRMFNVDRNEENLLVTKDNKDHRLVPIDHAYSLPETLEDGPLFTWMNWKQAKQPILEEVKNYLEDIDIERDERILRMLRFKEESIFIMKLSTLVLKIGARLGITLHDIAQFLTKNGNEPSPLEEIVKEAVTKGEENFWDNFVAIVSDRIVRRLL